MNEEEMTHNDISLKDISLNDWFTGLAIFSLLILAGIGLFHVISWTWKHTVTPAVAQWEKVDELEARITSLERVDIAQNILLKRDECHILKQEGWEKGTIDQQLQVLGACNWESK